MMLERNSILTVFRNLQRDAARYSKLGGWFSNIGFWIGATYRFRAWSRLLPSPLVRIPISLPFSAVSGIWQTFYNVYIFPSAQIGPGLCLIHPRNVMIGGSEIGENCLIFHEVTLGTNANSGWFPKLGKNVDVYVGARLLGGIQVGDNAKIGANCVITKNVPEGATVVVATNRVIPSTIVDAFGPRRPKNESGASQPGSTNVSSNSGFNSREESEK